MLTIIATINGLEIKINKDINGFFAGPYLVCIVSEKFYGSYVDINQFDTLQEAICFCQLQDTQYSIKTAAALVDEALG